MSQIIFHPIWFWKVWIFNDVIVSVDISFTRSRWACVFVTPPDFVMSINWLFLLLCRDRSQRSDIIHIYESLIKLRFSSWSLVVPLTDWPRFAWGWLIIESFKVSTPPDHPNVHYKLQHHTFGMSIPPFLSTVSLCHAVVCLNKGCHRHNIKEDCTRKDKIMKNLSSRENVSFCY